MYDEVAFGSMKLQFPKSTESQKAQPLHDEHKEIWLQVAALSEGFTGTRWRHLKRGSTYEVVGVAKLQTALTEGLADETPMVVYRNDANGKLSVRSLDEFCDGRFEIIAPDQKDASNERGAARHGRAMRG